MSNVGIIVGTVCGCMFLVAVLVGLYFYFRPRVAKLRASDDQQRAEAAADDEDLDPIPVVIGSRSGEQPQQRQRLLTSKRKKMDYIIDAVLSKAYPKEKEPATVQTCGIHVVDHHFVHGAIER
ncbi:membrane-associated protein, putative [Bodo saltans]|uniref:Membrane-associated protein, putative n=1 Tax=Bodo saltans TaxID=75058 RepID=A0A0S4IWM9_BODSA|nr:membrane-associated protein, putative [Bodo saltans]|eukprot:CUG30717.1 membrane-associated protein, putative [Bodo saltans]